MNWNSYIDKKKRKRELQKDELLFISNTEKKNEWNPLMEDYREKID